MTVLFGAKRLHRFDPCSVPGRPPRRKDSCGDKQARNRSERHWGVRLNSEEKTTQNASTGQSHDDTRRQSEAEHKARVPKYHASDLTALRAKCHPDANLPRLPCHEIRHNSMETGDAKDE